VPGTALLWLRRDLRLRDNPALARALADYERLVPVYIHAPSEEGHWRAGAASRWWLHHSLESLDRDLRSRGSALVIAQGADSLAELRRVIGSCGATAVFWNRCYEPAAIGRDRRIEQALRGDGLRCETTNGALLFEPWEVMTGERGPYRVFTPYWRRAAQRLRAPAAEAAPRGLPPLPDGLGGLDLDALELLPRIRWDSGLARVWQPGEPGAEARLGDFLAGPIGGYREERDKPGRVGTSRLSPHLHFGEIAPGRILRAIADQGLALDASPAEPFVREIGWREFAHHVLYHFPDTPEEPLDERFSAFPWAADANGDQLRAWERGRTGIPLVDAGLRELWETGWMHNRTRMVAASLLTKNLRLPWQGGARWFWDTLVDADLANNTLGWQWAAGCGADAAPYFRVFNPVRQGERFDPAGDYVRRWCPELARLPDSHIHAPWAAPAQVLADAGVRLGRDYPAPLVDLAASRRAALEVWEVVKA